MEIKNLNSFLDKGNRIAVVGVSGNHEKWGYRIYRDLKSAGFKVSPVNPGYTEIDGNRCYPNIGSIPEADKPDVVVTVVPPRVTEQIIKECMDLGIKRIWMQPGSESEKTISLCRENNIEAVYNACFVVDGLKKN